MEVGPDFVAFDTELIRYPERGERSHPGPWADRSWATVPFAQLYQLCRKQLTPAELSAEELTYGLDTVIYYNARFTGDNPPRLLSNRLTRRLLRATSTPWQP